MEDRIINLDSVDCYHLHNIWGIFKYMYVNCDAAQLLIHRFVMRQTAVTVQISAARLAVTISKFCHTMPLFTLLHMASSTTAYRNTICYNDTLGNCTFAYTLCQSLPHYLKNCFAVTYV